MKKIISYSLMALLALNVIIPLEAKGPLKVKGTPKDCDAYKPMSVSNRMDANGVESFIQNGYGQQENGVIGGYWDVISDRDGNTTYVNASADVPYSTLQFGEKVRIAKIKKGFALVYPVSDSTITYPSIPADIEWKGWVPMSNLVYLDHTLTSPLGCDVKILFSDMMENDPGHHLDAELYYKPSSDSSVLRLPVTNGTFFYQIKSEKGMELLAKKNVTTQESILGWVKSENVLKWNDRISIEPTWNPLTALSLADSCVSAVIQGIGNDSQIGSISFSKPLRDPYNPDNYRQFAGRWRLPVIYSDMENYRCAVPGTSDFLDRPSWQIKVHEDAINTDSVPTANLVFVIDGSRIYEPFFPILAEKIQELPNLCRGSINAKVAAVIYHDVRTNDKSIEAHPLTDPSDPSLFDFIDQGGEYGFKDNLSDSPLISAIEHASNLTETSGDNYIIIIGGRGDSSDGSVQELVEELCSKNVHLFGLHVQNIPTASSYRLFTYLLEDIQRSIASVRSEIQFNEGVSSSRTEWDELSNLTTYSCLRNGWSPFEGIIDIRSGILSEDDYAMYIDQVLSKIINNTSSSQEVVSSYPVYFRKAILPKMSAGKVLFKETVLYSEKELDAMIQLFNEITTACNSGERESLHSTLSKIAMEKLSVSAVKDCLIWNILESVEGIKHMEPYYPGPRLHDIQSDKTVSDAEFNIITDKISQTYRKLMRFQSLPYQYSTIINDERYFWIPLEDLL